MWDSSWLEGPVAESGGSTLLHFLWQGVLIVSLHTIGISLLARSTAQARYLLGVGCLLVLSLFPLVTFGWLISTFPVLDSSGSTALQLETIVTDSGDLPSVAATSIRWQPLEESTLVVLTPWRGWLLCGWGVGVIALSIRLAAGGWIVYRLRRRLSPLTVELDQQVDKLRRRLQVSSRIVVAASSRVTTAIACGMIRPLVLLPAAWLTEMSPSMLEAVIAHELAHIRRCDLWINLWQRIIETLWFYHPAVWWISASIRRERETCCDDLAVAALQDRVQYATTLEFLAKSRFAGTAPQWLSAGMGGSRMLLLHRVKHVLGMETPRGVLTHWPAICAVALLCVGMATMIRGGQTAVADEPDSDQTAEKYQQAAEEYEEAVQAAMADKLNSDRTAKGNRRAAAEYERALAVMQQAPAAYQQAAQLTADQAVDEYQRARAELEQATEAYLQAAKASGAEGPDIDWTLERNQPAEAALRQAEDAMFQASATEQRIQKLRTELDQARRQLHESHRVVEKLERELARAHEQFKWPKHNAELVGRGELDFGTVDPNLQRLNMRIETQRNELLRQRLEEQVEKAHSRHQQELKLRQQAIELDSQHRLQQQGLRRELALLQDRREGLRREQEVREIRKRMDEIKRRLKRSEDEDEQLELKHDFSQMESELEAIEADREITRKYHELESKAEQAEIESSVKSELKKLELESKLQLKRELEGLESELQALDREKTHLRRMQRELQSDDREK